MERQANSHLIYSSLPPGTIRVMDLLPGQEHETIQIKLHVVALVHEEPYKALSYTWGSATEGLRTVMCDQHDLQVTANLFEALMRFRDRTECQRLWIDAICIDQSSEKERSQQVQQMVKIYRNAEEVLVWLGTEAPHTDLELTFRVAVNRNLYGLFKSFIDGTKYDHLRVLSSDTDSLEIIEAIQREFSLRDQNHSNKPHFAQTEQPCERKMICIGSCNARHASTMKTQIILSRLYFANVRNLEPEDFGSFEEYLKAALKPPEYDLSDEEVASVFLTLYDLASRTYFTRAWIVQEIFAASHVTLVCGTHTVNFSYFWAVFGTPVKGVKNFTYSELKFRKPRFANFLFSRLRKVNDNIGDKGYEIRLLPFYRLDAVFDDRTVPREETMGGASLGDLLQAYGRQESSDPRDRIFSLIGMVIEYSTSSEEVEWCKSILDYSLDFRQLTILTAKRIVDSFSHTSGDDHRHNHFQILNFNYRNPDDDGDNLPSWAPCWSPAVRQNTSFPRFLRKGPLCNFVPYNAKVVSDSLFISGKIVDKVTYLSDLSEQQSGMYQEVEIYRHIQNSQRNSPYGNADQVFAAFWRNVIADNPGIFEQSSTIPTTQVEDMIRNWVAHCRLQYNQLCQTWGDRLSYRMPLHRLAGYLTTVINSGMSEDEMAELPLDISGLEDLSSNDTEELCSLLSQDAEWDEQTTRGRANGDHNFLQTGEGYFGLAPLYVKEGDVIAILAASNDVWCLRPQDSHYLLVGRIWVQGMMYPDDPYYQQEWKEHQITTIELR